jgi:adenine-specific DNA-methyltransferase
VRFNSQEFPVKRACGKRICAAVVLMLGTSFSALGGRNMPMLNWAGKQKVVNHHNEVPFHVTERKWTFGEDALSENMVIHGDNLTALKSLLPKYEGRVKCIYIDPPYNTGNEGWVYNDNVNDPQIRKWLGEVVGKEGEDFSRHDKWLCMMYPRLRLLQKLLADDGAIFISIDDNEEKYLHLMLDEIFGSNCFVSKIIWKNKYGPGAFTKGVGNVHEYIFCYSKTPMLSVAAPLSEEEIKRYKMRDDKFSVRGGFITQPLATRSKDDRPNLVYPVVYKDIEIWPDKQWIWEKSRLLKAIEDDNVVFNEKDGKWSVRFKQYLKDENGAMRLGKPISILTGPFNQEGTAEMEAIFGNRKTFPNPKPVELIRYLFSFVFNGQESKDGIYLDSFAGSGTTAHAVLKLNKEDGGNRKFILVEMMDYAESITAERVKRVISGYGEGSKAVEGTGCSFGYYELGAPLMIGENLNEELSVDKIREYVWYTETRGMGNGNGELGMGNGDDPYLLGVANDTAYYFCYEKSKAVTLDRTLLKKLKTKAGRYVIYADICLLDEAELERFRITFKKIPRDIVRL